jgi:hypothetical protein
MKKVLFYSILLTFLSVSCGSDDDSNSDNQDNLTTFLEDQTPKFQGMLNNEEVSFLFGPDTQSSSSVNSDPENDNLRVLQFMLNQNNGENYFTITTPAFDIASENEFNSVFGLGTKDIGWYYNHFSFNFLINGEVYQICGPQDGNEIEILQVNEFVDDSQINTLMVWFKLIDLNLINYCPSNNDFILEDGLIIAKFIGHRLE